MCFLMRVRFRDSLRGTVVIILIITSNLHRFTWTSSREKFLIIRHLTDLLIRNNQSEKIINYKQYKRTSRINLRSPFWKTKIYLTLMRIKPRIINRHMKGMARIPCQQSFRACQQGLSIHPLQP